MKPIDENQRNRYFTELAVALKRDGLETMPLIAIPTAAHSAKTPASTATLWKRRTTATA